MSRTRCRFVASVSTLALIAAFCVPITALAEVAHPAGGSLDVQIWPQGGETTVIVGLDVPPSVKLPTVVRLPFPPGTRVQWAGEILGGDPASDPLREHKVLKSAGGGEYAEFTLTKSHRAQIDTTGLPLTSDGATFSGKVGWIQSVDASATTISVRVPANAADVRITPVPAGAPDRNETGEALYTLPPAALTQGKTQPVTFSYSIGAPRAAASNSSSADGLVLGLGVALGVAVAGLLVLLAWQRRAPVSEVAPVRRTRSNASQLDRGTRGSSESERAPDDDDDSAFLID